MYNGIVSRGQKASTTTDRTKGVTTMKYYININQYGKLTDMIHAYYMGELGEAWEAHIKVKNAYDALLKVYEVTDKRKEDFENNPESVWFPLYRGYDREDCEFASEEEALVAYSDNIGQEVAEWCYDI